jgi:large subunit ribosomal protein L29
MKASELRDMKPIELVRKLDELKAELFNLCFQHAINQLDNPQRIKIVKRDIARVKTVMGGVELKDDEEEA